MQIDAAPGPEARMLQGEADKMLSGALEHLSEERRTVLMMRIDHDLGYGEIAETMGWSLQKVKNEIHRGRLVLRARLEKYVGGKE